MIGIYGGTTGERGEGARLAITYNGLTLNNPSDTLDGDSGPDTYEVDQVGSKTSYDYISEVNQQRDGMEMYTPRKVSRLINIRGTIRAPSQAKLHDKIKALANAFDPAKIAHDNDPDGDDPTAKFLALDFSVPTTDTANYASGIVSSRYYALPLLTPDPIISADTGFAAFFECVMVAVDPRRYWQTLTSNTGNHTIDNSLADYPSWPTFTVTMTGAGDAAYTVSNTTALHGTESLVLDLSGLVNTDVVSVDFERRRITVDGVDTPSLYVSGTYFHIDPVASNVIAHSNTTGTTTRTIAFRRAWSI